MADKRRFPRVTYLIEAQIWCVEEGVHWDVRLNDISEGGCFVDTLVALSDGSPVQVRVKDVDGITLEIPGRILYGQQTIGSAIAFDPLTPELRFRVQKMIARAAAQG